MDVFPLCHDLACHHGHGSHDIMAMIAMIACLTPMRKKTFLLPVFFFHDFFLCFFSEFFFVSFSLHSKLEGATVTVYAGHGFP